MRVEDEAGCNQANDTGHRRGHDDQQAIHEIIVPFFSGQQRQQALSEQGEARHLDQRAHDADEQ